MIRLTRVTNRLLGVSNNVEQGSSFFLRHMCLVPQLEEATHAIPDETPQHSQVAAQQENEGKPEKRRIGRRFVNSKILLKQLADLETKDSISPTAVYRFLKSCGQEMYGESPQQKILLAKEVWNRFKSRGVTMDVSHYNALLSTYVYNEHEFSPLEFLTEMQDSGITPNFITFLSLVRAFCSKRNVQGALQVIEFMNKENFAINELIYAALVEGYGIAGDLNNAKEVLIVMRENNCQPGIETYTTLAGCYAFAGDMEGVNKVLEEMAFKNLSPPPSTYLSIINSLSRGGHQKLISQILPMIKDVAEAQEAGHEVVKSMISRGDHAGAYELATFFSGEGSEDVDEDGKSKELRSFLGSVYTSSSSADNFLDVMKFLEEKELVSTPIEDALDYCYRRKDTDGAVRMINELFKAKRQVKTHYFYPVVKTLADNKDFEGLKNVFTLMGRKGINLDDSLLNFVRRGLKDMENLNEVILELVKQSRRDLPRATAFATIKDAIATKELDSLISVLPIISHRVIVEENTLLDIEGIIKSEFDAVKAAQVYKLMNEKKILRIGSSIARVIEHVTAEGSEIPGCDVVKFIKLLMEYDIKVFPSRIYTKAFALINKDNLKDDFFEMVRLMKEHDIQADEHQYIQMLKILATIGNSAAAQFCFEKIKLSSIKPNANMYSNLISAHWEDRSRDDGVVGMSSDQMVRITDLYEEMVEQGLTPISGILSKIAIAYLMQQRIDEVDEFIKKHGTGFRQLHVYNAYIRAYANIGRMEDAEKLFNWMKTEEGAPRPTHHSYHNLMSGYRASGNVDKIRELINEMKTAGLKPMKLTSMELVVAQLRIKDISGALDSLESIQDPEAYPFENIYRRVVRDIKTANDINSLRRAKDIITKQGVAAPSKRELDSLFAFMLVKNGRIEEALETVKSENWEGSPVEIKRVAEESVDDMAYLDAVKNVLKNVDKSTTVFDHTLLRYYAKSNDVDKALSLYKDKVELGQEIADSFQSRLDELLHNNDREVPAQPYNFGRRAVAYMMGALTAYRKLI